MAAFCLMAGMRITAVCTVRAGEHGAEKILNLLAKRLFEERAIDDGGSVSDALQVGFLELSLRSGGDVFECRTELSAMIARDEMSYFLKLETDSNSSDLLLRP